MLGLCSCISSPCRCSSRSARPAWTPRSPSTSNCRFPLVSFLLRGCCSRLVGCLALLLALASFSHVGLLPARRLPHPCPASCSPIAACVVWFLLALDASPSALPAHVVARFLLRR